MKKSEIYGLAWRVVLVVALATFPFWMGAIFPIKYPDIKPLENKIESVSPANACNLVVLK